MVGWSKLLGALFFCLFKDNEIIKKKHLSNIGRHLIDRKIQVRFLFCLYNNEACEMFELKREKAVMKWVGSNSSIVSKKQNTYEKMHI